MPSTPEQERGATAAVPGDSALQLVDDLRKALTQTGIAYCHWKSNDKLARTVGGEGDLDLLIKRSDIQQFTELMHRLGFKEAQTTPLKQMPGVLDYHGFDAESGKLMHVHAHYQLIFGQDFTKNYRLPLEDAYLAAATYERQGLRTPDPSFEFIIFIIRMMLKHMTWDSVLAGWGKLSKAELIELQDLQPRVDLARMEAFRAEHLPFLSRELLDACRTAIQPKSPMLLRMRSGAQLQAVLRPFARRSRLVDIAIKQQRRTELALRKRLAPLSVKKRFTRGGAIIAVVGGDGSGKSTVINSLKKWLAQDFAVRQMHMGKPTWSPTTKAVRGLLKLGNLFGRQEWAAAEPILYQTEATTEPASEKLTSEKLTSEELTSKKLTSGKSETKFPGYALLVRQICFARDRYLAYANAQKHATDGEIVISDRYPLPQVKLMDAPAIDLLAGERKTSRWVKFLSKLERRYYTSILRPDMLIILRVDPEIAVERALLRRAEEDPVPVRIRNGEVWKAEWDGIPCCVVDASQPADRVLAQVKAYIWKNL